MSKKNDKKTEAGVENVDRVLTTAEQFIEDNQKPISIVVVVILVALAAIVGIKRYYIAPKEKEAQTEMFQAEKYFELDSFNLALNGDNNYLGFAEIIDNYGLTKSANLAKYYAGICALQLGNFDDAIEYLESFKLKGELSIVALGATGDAYVELNDLEKGLDYYKKATAVEANDVTTPYYLMKAGLVSEELGNYGDALVYYNRIKKDFLNSEQGMQIEKYIARAEVLK